MGVVAVMVNLALLGMGGSVQRMFPNMTVTDRIILIVVLEVSFHSMTSWTIIPSSRSSHKTLPRHKVQLWAIRTNGSVNEWLAIGTPSFMFLAFLRSTFQALHARVSEMVLGSPLSPWSSLTFVNSLVPDVNSHCVFIQSIERNWYNLLTEKPCTYFFFSILFLESSLQWPTPSLTFQNGWRMR